MACFTAAIAELALVSVIKSRVEKREKAQSAKTQGFLDANASQSADKACLAQSSHEQNASISHSGGKIPLSTKLSWLITMLWGGVFLLAIEHIWHGEIIAQFPFLTAVRDGNTHEMLVEIATIGGGICVVIPLIWALGCYIAEKSAIFRGFGGAARA